METALSAWHSFPMAFDGNWVDILSIIASIGKNIYTRRKLDEPAKFFSLNNAKDVCNGLAVFPLFMLMAGVISTTLLQELIHANRMILGLAGFMALCAIVEEAN